MLTAFCPNLTKEVIAKAAPTADARRLSGVFKVDNEDDMFFTPLLIPFVSILESIRIEPSYTDDRISPSL